MMPKDFIEYLEDRIRGVNTSAEEIKRVIKEAFNQKKPTIFRLNEDDLINAILQILNKPEVTRSNLIFVTKNRFLERKKSF